jgi:hypothetical protein
MRKKRCEVSETEAALVERMRRHPHLRERFEAILKLAEVGEGEVGTADQVEGKLVEEVRLLGNATMRDWAGGAREKLEADLAKRESGVHRGKKNG